MKMETPKMDVVRFKEADVLAASPVPVDNRQFSKVAGWGDENLNQASISFKTGINGAESVHNFDELHRNPDMYGITYQNGSGKTVTLEQLAGSDAGFGEFNGTYIFSGDHTYTWFSNQ